jgi:hypothetical protein
MELIFLRESSIEKTSERETLSVGSAGLVELCKAMMDGSKKERFHQRHPNPTLSNTGSKPCFGRLCTHRVLNAARVVIVVNSRSYVESFISLAWLGVMDTVSANNRKAVSNVRQYNPCSRVIPLNQVRNKAVFRSLIDRRIL